MACARHLFFCFGAGLGVVLRIESNCRAEDGYEISTTQVGRLGGNRKEIGLRSENRDDLAEIVTFQAIAIAEGGLELARRGKAGKFGEERTLYVWLLSGLGYASVLNEYGT